LQDNNNIDTQNLENSEEKKEDTHISSESSLSENNEQNKNIPEDSVSPESPKEVSIEPEKETGGTKFIPSTSKDSNYQVSLINENLLRIRVSTVKSVSIDCSVKDKSSTGSESSESQTNKILIHPKPDNKPQEVEIIISIDSDGNIVVEKKKIIL
jgi:hypothetical protein